MGENTMLRLVARSSAREGSRVSVRRSRRGRRFKGGPHCHETWSPYIANAPGDGYLVYNHTDGGTSYTLSGCAAVSNTATCTTSGGLSSRVAAGNDCDCRGQLRAKV